MQIEKKYKDENKWFDTTFKECIEHTENSGYWKPGSAEAILKLVGKIETPAAIWRVKHEN